MKIAFEYPHHHSVSQRVPQDNLLDVWEAFYRFAEDRLEAGVSKRDIQVSNTRV